jgi:hypothetical protein
VEGHCDERASEEYNLALGTNRAESLKCVLLRQGVSEDRIKTISYGRERPFCSQDNDQCWQQNRVDHFALARGKETGGPKAGPPFFLPRPMDCNSTLNFRIIN